MNSNLFFKESNKIIFIIALLLFVCATFFYGHITLAIVELVVWIMLFVYYIISTNSYRKHMSKYVQMLEFQTNTTTKESLLKFPMPLTVLQADGTIIWYNKQFATFVGRENKIFENKLSDIFGEQYEISHFINESDDNKVDISINGYYFTVVTNAIKTDEQEVLLVQYWIDKTDFENLKNLYYDRRPIVLSIVLDNYDEVIQSTQDSDLAMLLAAIDRKISDWIITGGGVVKKLDRDKYIGIIEYHYFEKCAHSNFDILESIKNISIGNKIPFTISIGIGIEDNSLNLSETQARSASQMALGRGGDQVVVSQDGKFTYYGGTTKEIERHTRVRTRVMSSALKQLIDNTDLVMIMGHKNADMDSIGAALGICAYARSVGKKVAIVCESTNSTTQKIMQEIKDNIDFSNCIIGHSEALEMISKNTLLIVVDVYRAAITECPLLLDETTNVVVLDHHRKPAEFIENTVLAYHEPYASSTSEIVTELLEYMDDGKCITPLVAKALYAGIILDTKNFTFKAGIRTFEAATFLKRLGVDTTQTKQLFQQNREIHALKSKIINKLELLHNDTIAVSVSNAAFTNDTVTIAAQAADEMLDIDGVQASFVISNYEQGYCYISGRSLGKINVQLILEALGGGGHISIAAAQLECSVLQAKIRLVEAIDNYFEKNK